MTYLLITSPFGDADDWDNDGIEDTFDADDDNDDFRFFGNR